MPLYWNNLNDLQKIKLILDKNKILLASSDTVLGLFGKLTLESYQQLNILKNRSKKPYLIMIRSVDILPIFVDQIFNNKMFEIIDFCWPGPVTLIFRARTDLPNFLKSSDKTVALRIPAHQGLLELLKSYDGLFSTSANTHGRSVPQSMDEVDSSILNSVGDICIDKEFVKGAILPSTILDCSSGSIQVIRSGCCLDERLKIIIEEFNKSV